jgi:N-acetyl-anhydromuramyl-L-alanine amidase AmpD
MTVVLDPHELVWTPGTSGCHLRTEPVSGVIWHWTAGEGSPDGVVRILQQRGLSVHYVIGYDGTLKRCADPETTVCYHAGKTANARFVGVEIANKALGPASAKRPRDLVPATAHGRKFVSLDFTDAQYATIRALADELSERFDIPRSTAQGDTVLPFLGRFRGHAEHIHVTRKKIDCGGLVMSALRSHGYA